MRQLLGLRRSPGPLIREGSPLPVLTSDFPSYPVCYRVLGLFITRVPGFLVSYMKSITNDVVGAEIKVNCAVSVYY
jgi:hypothetical protein